MLTFHFSGADGKMAESETLTSGMVGKEVKLVFSQEWDKLTKTAVFTAGAVTRDVVNVSDVAEIPAEVLKQPMQWLYVGVYGVSAAGKATPTIRVKGPWIEPGADPSGDISTADTLPVWGQLQTQIDGLKENGTGGGGNCQCESSGAIFTPAVSEEGVLSWSNNMGLENPDPVSIRGPQGPRGTPGEVTIQPPTYAATVKEMTDTSKVYIGANGNLWAYQTGATSVVTARENIDGLIDNSRLGSDGSTATDATAYAGYVATDYIDLLKYSIPFQLHIDGGVFLPAAADSYTRMGTYTADKTKITVLQPIRDGIDQILNVPDSDVTVDDNNNLTITFNQTPTTNNANNDGVLQYVRFSGKGEPDTVSVYITFESEVSGDGWVDTGIKYSPSLTDAEKTQIAEEAAGLIDTELLGVIGDGTVTV